MSNKLMAIISMVFIWVAVVGTAVYIGYDISPVTNSVVLAFTIISYIFAVIFAATGWARKKSEK